MIIRNAIQLKLPQSDGFIGGFWGVVREVNSRFNAVTVLMSRTQQVFTDIPVMSREWVSVKDSFVPGERDLPPVGSTVFVCTPEGTIDSAFVLCSGYFVGETSEHTLFASSDNEKEEKNSIIERVSQGGWTFTEDSRNGTRTETSLEEDVSLSIDFEEKKISLIAFGQSFEIAEDSIALTDSNGNKVSTTSEGIEIEDKNGNKINSASSGIKIEDKNGNKIETSTTSVSINGNFEVLQ